MVSLCKTRRLTFQKMYLTCKCLFRSIMWIIYNGLVLLWFLCINCDTKAIRNIAQPYQHKLGTKLPKTRTSFRINMALLLIPIAVHNQVKVSLKALRICVFLGHISNIEPVSHTPAAHTNATSLFTSQATHLCSGSVVLVVLPPPARKHNRPLEALTEGPTLQMVKFPDSLSHQSG